MSSVSEERGRSPVYGEFLFLEALNAYTVVRGRMEGLSPEKPQFTEEALDAAGDGLIRALHGLFTAWVIEARERVMAAKLAVKLAELKAGKEE